MRNIVQLADVELQLCMQFLSSTELLHFARCSPRLLHAADSDFAWKFAGPSILDASPEALKASTSRLLRHASAFRMVLRNSRSREEDVDRLITIAATKSIIELDLSACVRIAPPQLARILGCQDLREHVRVFRGNNHAQLGLQLEHIVSFPRLHTLDINGRIDPSQWRLLAEAPCLTSLSVIEPDAAVALPALSNCTGLNQLSFRNPELYESAWKDFFCSPNVQGLQSLTLRQFDAAGVAGEAGAPPAVDFATSFVALRSLHYLHLNYVAHVDRLLPHLAHATALRQLVITHNHDSYQRTATLPSIAVLTELLNHATELHCTLQIDSWSARFWPDWPACKERLQRQLAADASVQAIGPRLQLHYPS